MIKSKNAVIYLLSVFTIVALFAFVAGLCSFYFSFDGKESKSLNNKSFSILDTSSPFFSETLPYSSVSSSSVTSLADQGNIDYYSSYLHDKIYTLSKIREQNHIDFTFAFLTDLHWPTNAKKSPYLLKSIDKQINIEKVVLGGDYINLAYDDCETAKSVMRSCVSSFSSFNYTAIVGNHDANTAGRDWSARLSDVEIYNEINNCDSEYPYSSEKIYDKKICLIYLNTGVGSFDDDLQKRFLYNSLTELNEDWVALIFLHIVFDGTYENNNDSIIQPTGIEFTNYLNIISSEVKCSVVGAFSGHSHLDYLDTTTYSCPMVTTMCDSIGAFSSDFNIYYRKIDTFTEQAFDIIQIDILKRKVFLTRIGCGSDRTFHF